ncbi:nucleotidyltransferase family protein [Proteiniborus sp. MB09-C3]|uniref:nucleotidyltransferase family protein n=1 Tax=Proteiniborus sp. MB09-C3 TaxID=3050072 RepID=UPI002552F826|nr:nucleotidyltransferase family protein [Proteiniborus sp. MB09-C3]WIV11927.1 nucleotidyltransferase family protein [Proteiniborus sp. MB09-C3]
MNKIVVENKDLKKDLAVIILAAGYSSRMKLFKPLLPLGHSTVIEYSIDGFKEAGFENIIVVVGFQAKKLIPILEHKGVRWIYNERYEEGMYSSIVAGVKSLSSHVKGFFLLPADIPLVKNETVDSLVEGYKQSKKSIIYPSFSKRRGHPPLISSCLFSEIVKYDGSGGLKALLKKYEDQAYYVEVEDEGVVIDIDTYEDYLKLRAKFECQLQAYDTL